MSESRLADRLEALLAREGGPAELARKCGINKSTVPNLIDRLRQREAEEGGSAALFARLVKFTGCNPAWLHEGQGPMYLHRSSDPFDRVLDERAWSPVVVAAVSEQRKDGVARTEDDWRRIFLRFARAAEPTPVPASSKVRARR